MGDRVAVLKDGFLQQVGDAPAPLRQSDQRVRGGVHRVAVDEPLRVHRQRRRRSRHGVRRPQTVAFGSETLAKFPSLGQFSGQRVIVGIRPEDFEDAVVADEAPPDRRVHGQAKLVEALGSELMVHFVLDDAKTVNSGDPDAPEQELGEGISNAVARFSPRSKVHTDDAMEIAVNTDNLHFFDAQTPANAIAVVGGTGESRSALHGTGQDPPHEEALEQEEHDQRHRRLDERAGRSGGVRTARTRRPDWRSSPWSGRRLG